MRKAFYRPLMIAAICMAVYSTCLSQPAATPLPSLFAGETLKFEGKADKVIHGIAVADLTFSVSDGPNSGESVIKAEAVSKGTLLKLFRYSFSQQYGSVVDRTTFRALKSTKHDVQKERVRDSEAVFDYKEKRVSYTETDPKDPTRPPRIIASAIGEQTYDMISAIYAIRLLPLSIGKKMELSISDSGLVYKIPFVVTAREMQSTVLGKVMCFRVEPEIFGKDRLIEHDGKMVIWMTADERHTPVRSTIKTGFGKFDIKLRSAPVVSAPRL